LASRRSPQLVSRQIHTLEAHIAQLIDSDPLRQKLDATRRDL